MLLCTFGFDPLILADLSGGWGDRLESAELFNSVGGALDAIRFFEGGGKGVPGGGVELVLVVESVFEGLRLCC
jgi:hypothetical protein